MSSLGKTAFIRVPFPSLQIGRCWEPSKWMVCASFIIHSKESKLNLKHNFNIMVRSTHRCASKIYLGKITWHSWLLMDPECQPEANGHKNEWRSVGISQAQTKIWSLKQTNHEYELKEPYSWPLYDMCIDWPLAWFFLYLYGSWRQGMELPYTNKGNIPRGIVGGLQCSGLVCVAPWTNFIGPCVRRGDVGLSQLLLWKGCWTNWTNAGISQEECPFVYAWQYFKYTKTTNKQRGFPRRFRSSLPVS